MWFDLQGFGVHHALNPDPYRGPFGADGKLYSNDLANLLESATPGRIAGFFHETIQVAAWTIWHLQLFNELNTPCR